MPIGRPIADLVLGDLAALIDRFGVARTDASFSASIRAKRLSARLRSPLGQGGAGLIQEGLRDLAADGFQLGDALL